MSYRCYGEVLAGEIWLMSQTGKRVVVMSVNVIPGYVQWKAISPLAGERLKGVASIDTWLRAYVPTGTYAVDGRR